MPAKRAIRRPQSLPFAGESAGKMSLTAGIFGP